MLALFEGGRDGDLRDDFDWTCALMGFDRVKIFTSANAT